MMPNLNPKNMSKMMKKLGVSMEELDAEKVTISLKDGSELNITDPEVVKMNMKGKDSFQVSGKIEEGESEPDFSEDDIETVVSKAGVSEKEAKEALKEANGDIAKAILNVKEGEE